MALLGFDAIGERALGQLPSSPSTPPALVGSAGVYSISGGPAQFYRDFINWFPEIPQASSWQDQRGSSGGWALTPPPSNTWSVEPTKSIPPKVCQ